MGASVSAATLQCARPLLLDSLVTLKDNLFIRWLLAGRLLQKAIDMPEGRND
jgi:hypothetical protein